jgi:hypothetical protein
LLQYREDIRAENVSEGEVYTPCRDTILIVEETSMQLKVKISKLMHVVIGRRI